MDIPFNAVHLHSGVISEPAKQVVAVIVPISGIVRHHVESGLRCDKNKIPDFGIRLLKIGDDAFFGCHGLFFRLFIRQFDFNRRIFIGRIIRNDDLLNDDFILCRFLFIRFFNDHICLRFFIRRIFFKDFHIERNGLRMDHILCRDFQINHHAGTVAFRCCSNRKEEHQRQQQEKQGRDQHDCFLFHLALLCVMTP